ncbi:MAG: hypothetical protein ACOZD0_06705 [Pseudomonadota bacterium]
MASTIIGGTSLHQLRGNLASIDVTLPEVIDGIDAIRERDPNPAP